MTVSLPKPPNDDILVFADDPPVTAAPSVSNNPWRVLVVDDDPDVHHSTAFALDLTWTLERPIQLLRAESAAQARDILAPTASVARRC